MGAGNSPTHSLKDLLISSSVDMEAATDTNITALCAMYGVFQLAMIFIIFTLVLTYRDIEPSECTNCFEKSVSYYMHPFFYYLYCARLLVLIFLYRFLSFSEACDSAHKSDISHILYPIFVHIYLNLVAGDHSELGKDSKTVF